MSEADKKNTLRLVASWSKVFERPNFGPKWMQRLHSKMFRFWREVVDETEHSLDEKQITLLYLMARDAIDIGGAIADTYPIEELLTSLVYVEWLGLFNNELPTFYLLFLSGQYRHVMSQLRFNWERIFQAWRADDKCRVQSSDSSGSSLAEVDHKHDWLAQHENNSKWPGVIRPTLRRLFRLKGEAMTTLESRYKSVWDRLNRCVHPSGDLREKSFRASMLHLRCTFDEGFARGTLDDAAEVFGLIWLAMLSWFPKAIKDLKSDLNTFQDHPHLRAALEAHSANPTR